MDLVYKKRQEWSPHNQIMQLLVIISMAWRTKLYSFQTPPPITLLQETGE